jgi:hypothetical protein
MNHELAGSSVEGRVIPAKAGIQFLPDVDPRPSASSGQAFRGGDILTFTSMGAPPAHDHSLGAAYREADAKRSAVGMIFGGHNISRQDVAWDRHRTSVITLKLKERTGNFYENKGSLWKTGRRSGNVYENK